MLKTFPDRLRMEGELMKFESLLVDARVRNLLVEYGWEEKDIVLTESKMGYMEFENQSYYAPGEALRVLINLGQAYFIKF